MLRESDENMLKFISCWKCEADG